VISRAVLKDVSYAYAKRTVLASLDLSLFAGEILCLLGPNGAGKSTLVRLLCGLVKPAAGRIDLEDGITLKDIALVPQQVALYPWLTGLENCVAFGRFAGLSSHSARAAAEEALALTDCVAMQDVAVRRLSGGYQRRINIAVALVARPRILVLDEPTVGIDLEARAHIATILRRLRDRGASVLLVTHDFSEADAVAERLAFLKDGSLVAWGSPQSLAALKFDGRKQLDILLPAQPDQATRLALARFGAVSAANDMVWQSFEAMDGWDTGAVARRLEAARIPFSELRLRAPGVEALYGAFCGAHAAP
jgi:ABC-2 type transport system ATP-binding protein